MEKQTIGEFIAALRKSRGMTQKQLAEILNVSDKTISHWERNESSPDLSMIPILSEIFEITCDELLQGEKNPITTLQKAENTLSLESEKRFYYLINKTINNQRIVAIISIGLSLMALIIGIPLCKEYTILCEVTLIVCLLSCMLITLSYFEVKDKIGELENEKTKRYRQKLNAYLTYPLSINLVIAGLSVNFIPNYIKSLWPFEAYFITVALFLVSVIIIYVLMKKDKLYVKPRTSIFILRAKSIFAFIVLFILGTSVFLIISEANVSKTTTNSIVFENPIEFKEYMETPKDSLEKNSVAEFDEAFQILYNPETDTEWVSFCWKNKEVIAFEEYWSRAKFTGYEVHIQQENETYTTLNNIKMTFSYAVPIYYIILCFTIIYIYNRKKKMI